MTESGTGSLVDEARRLAEALSRVTAQWGESPTTRLSDWAHQHDMGDAPECRYCPLCRLIALLRGDRPEVAARLLAAGTAFAEALRTAVVPPVTDPEPPPRVQHIDVG